MVESQQKSLAAAALVMQTLGTAYLQITKQWGDVIQVVIDVAPHDHESGAVLATAQRRHHNPFHALRSRTGPFPTRIIRGRCKP